VGGRRRRAARHPPDELARRAGAASRAHHRTGEAVDLGAIAGSEPSVPRFNAGVDHWRRDATFEAFALRSPLAPIAAALLRSERVDRRRAVSVRYCGDDARYLHRPGLVAGPDLASVSDGAPVGPPAHPVAWPRA
jgi:hypothetical protein